MDEANNPQIIRKLILGIDYGTTYAAVSFALQEWSSSQQPSTTALNDIKLEPVRFGQSGFSENQVKTQIAWHSEFQDFVWGESVDSHISDGEIPEEDRIVLLKLGLEKSPATEDIRAKHTAQLSRIPPGSWRTDNEPRTPLIEDLISIFLARLYGFAKDEIVKTYGTSASEEIYSTSDVQCVLCVPAMWTPEINQTMVTAAEIAGLPNPDIVSESEAAAAFYLREKEQEEALLLRHTIEANQSKKPYVSRFDQAIRLWRLGLISKAL